MTQYTEKRMTKAQIEKKRAVLETRMDWRMTCEAIKARGREFHETGIGVFEQIHANNDLPECAKYLEAAAEKEALERAISRQYGPGTTWILPKGFALPNGY